MTDNEIIKALEHCIDSCNSLCPLHKNKDCRMILNINALDLINRQKAEIKSLKEKAKRWKENYESQQVVVGDFREIINKQAKELKTAKAEAVKEFADKVLLYIPNIEGDTTIKCVEEAIKQTLKETVGNCE